MQEPRLGMAEVRVGFPPAAPVLPVTLKVATLCTARGVGSIPITGSNRGEYRSVIGR